MHFYSLNMFPDSDAETCAEEEEGYNQGDAPQCPACGSTVGMLAWLPPFRVVLKLYGKEFGDFAFLLGADDFLVSRRFQEIYSQHGLTGLCGFDPVEVVRVKSRRRKLPEPPPYFRVNAGYGGPVLDLTASGFEWLEPPTCPLCRTATIVRWQRLVLEAGTWSGQDAFRPRGMAGEMMVSQRFKDACDQHGIKNACFTPAEIAGHDFYPGLKDLSELDLPPK